MTTAIEIAPAVPSASGIGPVRPSERIAEMDFLRGFALLGIALLHTQVFSTPWSLRGSTAVELYPGGLDKAVVWIMSVFGAGKFLAIFSFLFGVGFAIQMDRATGRGAPFAWIYFRRMLALFAFGVAHVVFLWTGDILHVYAGLGLALIVVRKLPDRWLWVIVACCALLPTGRTLVMMARQEKPARTAEQRLERGLDELRVYGRGEYVLPRIDKDKATGALKPPLRVTGSGTYPQTVADRISDMIFQYRNGMSGWFWATTASTLLIGFIAGRRRFFQNIPRHIPLIRKITWSCAAIGLVLALAGDRLPASRGGGGMSAVAVTRQILYTMNRPVLAAFYMGAVVLLAQRPV
jgi:uncharacterized protein